MNRRDRRRAARKAAKQGKAPAAKPATPKADAMLAEAVAHHSAGRLADAVAIYDQLLGVDPDQPDALHLKGVAVFQAGEAEDGLGLIARAIELRPDVADYHANLGNMLWTQGRAAEAEGPLERAVELNPDHAEAHNNLGNTLEALGRDDAALERFARAVELKSDYGDAHGNYGISLHRAGRLNEAEAMLRRALELDPASAQAHNNLGNALRDLARFEEAESLLRRAVELKPDYANAHYNLGIALFDQRRLEDAEAALRRALALDPDSVGAHNNLAVVLSELGRYEEAEDSVRRAIDLDPEHGEAHNNLGVVLRGLGHFEAAEDAYRRALALDPGNADAHSNLIFVLDFGADYDLAEKQAERRHWAEQHEAPLATEIQPHSNDRNPDRRLRIGYVSADFRHHSAAASFGPVLFNHDPENFEVFCYSCSVREDHMTDRIRDAAAEWRACWSVPDAAVAEQIRADRIDVLVDLSGHSAGNRLLVFARKPAPVQVTAWGHATGTGLETMDYFMADPVFVPPEEESLYAEKIHHLPSGLAYMPPEECPAVGPLPAEANGFITFGSFNRLDKVSDETLGLWSEILAAVPNSRLMIKAQSLDNEAIRGQFGERLFEAGFEESRVDLMGGSSQVQHLDAHNRVDIALDPFPHGGGITTMESLWMGTPVVTLRGPTIAGRTTASALIVHGLDRFIAETTDSYRHIAAEAAGDIDELARLKASLRQTVATSPAGDAAQYTAAVEAAYREMWREWCAARPAPAVKPTKRRPKKKKRKRAKKPVDQALFDTARAHHHAGRLAEAELIYGNILADDPDNADAMQLKGVLALQGGKADEALALIECAIELEPGAAIFHGNLGFALIHLGRNEDAEAALRRAIDLDPKYARAHSNLSTLLCDSARFEEAEASIRRAIELEPDQAEAYNNLGVILRNRGEFDAALEAFRQAMTINPANARAHSNLIFVMDFIPDRDLAELQDERRDWNRRYAAPLAPTTEFHDNDPDPDRRLRIGYVSGDFRRHSAAYAFGPALLNHDPATFEIVCYSTSTIEDELTADFKRAAALWRPCWGMADDALAGQIRADGIDILVDLSGHSAGNRLLVFARKPAPVQATGWGHATGTGLTAIDYRFTDRVMLREGEAELYAERPCYLPCSLGYMPPADAPETAPLPAKGGNPITFGCLNRLDKVTDEALALWSGILLAVPDSRLVLKGMALDDGAYRERLGARLKAHGIDPARVGLAGSTAQREHLQAYGEVDLALDPIPLGGGVSSLESLWMGVPVVTLLGMATPGRVSAAILTAIGLEELIAESPEQYREMAIALAGDPARLEDLRSGLRDRLAASPLGDGRQYAAAVEDAYREMWRAWCETR
jgi:predicted O-linked N-acetylglucosamine transferase (SPINDLY family)